MEGWRDGGVEGWRGGGMEGKILLPVRMHNFAHTYIYISYIEERSLQPV
jgi:hypothetical protein